MSTHEQTIEALSRAILSEAREETEKIKVEAVEKANAIRKRAQEQAEAERKEILDRARQDADRLRSQVIATAELKARTMLLEHREKLLDQVFKGAKDKLIGLQKRADYDKVAANLLREALVQLGINEAHIRVDAGTRKVLKDQVLDQISKELNSKLSMQDPLKEGIGVIVDTANGHIHYDNTLETRLNRLQSSLRSSVYQVLMGEKL